MGKFRATAAVAFDLDTLVILILSLSLTVELTAGFKDGLYSTDTDDVIPLNEKTFQSELVNGKPSKFWVVEFYNSWCGHCIHFAPSWKKVATGFKEWQDIVAIAAIDCSQAVNLETCRQFDINAYPSMKLFPPSEVEDRMKKVEPFRTQDPLEIKKLVLQFMIKYTPASWPRLKPLKKIEDIWQEKQASHEYTVLIFEEQNSILGMEVILDTRHHNNVLVRSMLKEDVTKFGINSFPSLYRVNPDSTYTLVAVGKNMAENDRVFFTNLVKAMARGQEDKIMPRVNKQNKFKVVEPGVKQKSEVAAGNVAVTGKPKLTSSVVSMQDLESALHYSFRQEVAICRVIDGEKLVALKDFVHTLLKYFPGRPQIQGFLKKTYDMLISLPSDDLSGEEWMDKIDRLQDSNNYLPEVVKWESCVGSHPRYRGYPCSMWTLFHTLTVGDYKQNSHARARVNASEVLVSIRGYMKYFFGCEECSKNFLSMAETVEGDVQSSRDSVLWLWSAHNKANKRLHNDISEDPQHLKIQFPSPALCPACHKSVVADDGKPTWDADAVLEFLTKFYGESSIVIPEGLNDAESGKSLKVEGSEKVADLSHQDRELDWWEKKQREQDLKQIQRLRKKKQEKKSGLSAQGGLVKRSQEEDGVIVYKQDGNVGHPQSRVSALLGVTQLDMSMCVVFYVVSTLIILILYHHFIVRRHMKPCKSIRATALSL